MLTNFDIGHLLTFPFKDEGARKNFLIGALVALANFIIPILPSILMLGYMAGVVRGVVRGEKASLPKWEDWNGFLLDGARIFAVQLIYSLPILLILAAFIIAISATPLILEGSSQSTVEIFFAVGLSGLSCLFLPIALLFSIASLMAGLHTAVTGEFQAGFRVREWWGILRSNLGGFALAYLISMAFGMVIGMITNLLIFSFIFACLFPLLLPPISMYSSLVTYAALAQAYRDGREQPAAEAAH